jgi:hypothetical protein
MLTKYGTVHAFTASPTARPILRQLHEPGPTEKRSTGASGEKKGIKFVQVSKVVDLHKIIFSLLDKSCFSTLANLVYSAAHRPVLIQELTLQHDA